MTKYFTIKKKNNKESKGNYLEILFYCVGDVLIKNTEKNNGGSFVFNSVFIIIFSIICTIIVIFNLTLNRKENLKENNDIVIYIN